MAAVWCPSKCLPTSFKLNACLLSLYAKILAYLDIFYIPHILYIWIYNLYVDILPEECTSRLCEGNAARGKLMTGHRGQGTSRRSAWGHRGLPGLVVAAEPWAYLGGNAGVQVCSVKGACIKILLSSLGNEAWDYFMPQFQERKIIPCCTDVLQ